MKILNLYAGLGGNRLQWGDEHEITAVEAHPDIALVYKNHFEKDNTIVGDALSYLETIYKEYDFIWASPPCTTHSAFRREFSVNLTNTPAKLPDMSLYSIILFLQHYYEGKWCVENVNPFYRPLIKPTVKIGRHLFWSNIDIKEIKVEKQNGGISGDTFDPKDFELYEYWKGHKYPGVDRRSVLKNCVDSNIGRYILECVTGEYTQIKKKTHHYLRGYWMNKKKRIVLTLRLESAKELVAMAGMFYFKGSKGMPQWLTALKKKIYEMERISHEDR